MISHADMCVVGEKELRSQVPIHSQVVSFFTYYLAANEHHTPDGFIDGWGKSFIFKSTIFSSSHSGCSKRGKGITVAHFCHSINRIPKSSIKNGGSK